MKRTCSVCNAITDDGEISRNGNFICHNCLNETASTQSTRNYSHQQQSTHTYNEVGMEHLNRDASSNIRTRPRRQHWWIPLLKCLKNIIIGLKDVIVVLVLKIWETFLKQIVIFLLIAILLCIFFFGPVLMFLCIYALYYIMSKVF